MRFDDEADMVGGGPDRPNGYRRIVPAVSDRVLDNERDRTRKTLFIPGDLQGLRQIDVDGDVSAAHVPLLDPVQDGLEPSIACPAAGLRNWMAEQRQITRKFEQFRDARGDSAESFAVLDGRPIAAQRDFDFPGDRSKRRPNLVCDGRGKRVQIGGWIPCRVTHADRRSLSWCSRHFAQCESRPRRVPASS